MKVVYAQSHLEYTLERSDIVIVCRRQFSACLSEGFRSGRLSVSSDCADAPSFLKHSSGDRTANTASGTADCDKLCHVVDLLNGLD